MLSDHAARSNHWRRGRDPGDRVAPLASRIVGIGEAVENTRTGEYPDETTHNSIYWCAYRCGGCGRIFLLSKDEERHHNPSAQSRAEALAD